MRINFIEVRKKIMYLSRDKKMKLIIFKRILLQKKIEKLIL